MTAINDTFTVERACVQALYWHAGQVDKQGQPYILHPLRVMLAVSERARIVAVLHDVLEDTNASADYLEQYLEPPDMLAVALVTRVRGEPYRDFIDRIASAPGEAGDIAREVKIADIEDNMGRWTDDLPASLWNRYRQALDTLRSVVA